MEDAGSAIIQMLCLICNYDVFILRKKLVPLSLQDFLIDQHVYNPIKLRLTFFPMNC